MQWCVWNLVKHLRCRKLREKCTYSEFFWSVFLRIWAEYEEDPRISSITLQNTVKSFPPDFFVTF